MAFKMKGFSGFGNSPMKKEDIGALRPLEKGEGKAKANNNPAPGTIIGKALEASTGDATIEVVVGRF